MKKCIVYVVFLVATVGFAQAPDTLWTKTCGGAEDDYANSILLTNDGGFILAGETNSFGAGAGDVWIVKTDSLGNTLWTKTYGDTTHDYATAIRHTTDGAYIIVGAAQDSAWLLKIDGNGDTLWTRKVRPNIVGYYNPVGYDIKQTSDGGYVIAGRSGLHLGDPVLLIKTDSFGDPLWAASDVPPGDGYSVQQTSDGGYVIAGRTRPNPSGLMMFKTDSLGNMLWQTLYGIYPTTSSGRCVLETADSGFITCGMMVDRFGLHRTNMYGELLWTESYAFVGYYWGIANSLIRTVEGNFLAVGCVEDDAVFLKADSLGNQLWAIVIGDSLNDSGVLNSVQQTADGGYIAVGYTNASGAGGYDAWMVRVGPDVGIEEGKEISVSNDRHTATILSGPLQLPEDEKCKVFDITGRAVELNSIRSGIYFIEIDGVVTQKVVKVR